MEKLLGPHSVGVLRRLRDAVKSKSYRRAIAARIVCRLIRFLNPDARYLGLAHGEEMTFLLVDDAVITPWVIATGDFQKAEVDSVIQWCEKFGSLGGVFVDVGANIGTTTLYALRSGRFASAVCIEPAPSNLAVLRMNLVMNGLEDRARVVPMGASRKPGTGVLYLSRENSGDHRMDSRAKEIAARHRVEVGVTSVDAVIADAGIDPRSVSCVWVDTQGHEASVLAGAEALVAAGVPFCIEFWPSAYRTEGTLEEILEGITSRFAAFVDLGAPASRARPAQEIRELAAALDGPTTHTDLFLIPRGRE